MMKTTLSLLAFMALLPSCYTQAQNGHTNIPDSLPAVCPPGTVSALAPEPKEALRPDSITFALSGDIMMGTTYPTVQLPKDEGADIFTDVQDLLFNADVAVGNLEGTLTDGGKCTKGRGPHSYAFRTPVRMGARLQEAGYDYLGLANNHINDFGPEGVSDTEETLDGLGIAYSGMKGHKPYAIIERAGYRIACLAFGQNSYSLRHTQTDQVLAALEEAKKENPDLIIVSMHGGAEGRDRTHLPRTGYETFLGENRGALREFAHLCIDNGVDIVYGHGPHVTRCCEVYKGRFIAYSLGNFATPFGMSLAGVSAYAPVVTLTVNADGSLRSGRINSFIQTRGVGPRLDENNLVAREMRNLTLSDIDDPTFTIADDGTITLK